MPAMAAQPPATDNPPPPAAGDDGRMVTRPSNRGKRPVLPDLPRYDPDEPDRPPTPPAMHRAKVNARKKAKAQSEAAAAKKKAAATERAADLQRERGERDAIADEEHRNPRVPTRQSTIRQPFNNTNPTISMGTPGMIRIVNMPRCSQLLTSFTVYT